MTTNKPEVAMTLLGGEQLIRLSDYERLQADHERLRAEREKLRNIISDLKEWDCDVSGGFLSIPLDLRRRMQEAIDAATQETSRDD